MPPKLKWNAASVDLETVISEIGIGHTPRFSIDPQGQIIDPFGKLFIPVGINVNGANWVWGDPTIGASATMARWGFNTIRVNNFISGDPWGNGAPIFHENDDLVALVDEYTAKKYVVILCNHTYGSTTQLDVRIPANMARLIDWWEPIAEQFKENVYVWFNPINEPTSGPQGYSGPDYGLNDWQALSTQLGDAIRAVAPNCMLVFDGHGSGQDKGHGPSCMNQLDFTWPLFNFSAAIQKGPAMQAHFGRDRMIMSAHYYNEWAGIAQPYPGCVGPVDDPFFYFRSDTNAYLDRLRDLGIPMLYGEFGARVNDDEEWFQAGANDAARILMEQIAPVRTAPRPGILFWHASGGDLRYLENFRSEWTNWNGDYANLNFQGLGMVNYAQLVAAS